MGNQRASGRAGRPLGMKFQLLNHDAALKLARLGDVEMPSPEEQLRYGPLGAVARAVKEKYLGEEPLENCLKRTIKRMTFYRD